MATKSVVMSEAQTGRGPARRTSLHKRLRQFRSVGVGTRSERKAQIESLVHELRTREVDASVSHAGRSAFAQDLERIHDWSRDEMEAQGIHGLGIFCCSAAGIFETIGVSAPVGPCVYVDRTAQLGPLLAATPAEAWCVLLVNRCAGRIFRGNRDRLEEIASVTDDVHGQHDRDGWSQARYERSVENEAMGHVQRTCDRLFDAFEQRPFGKLLVGCSDELRTEVEGRLHPYLRERLVDHFEGEVEHTNHAEVSERVRPLIEMHERRAEATIIERLGEQLGRQERSVAGLTAVLEALNQKAVEILLMAPGFEASGAVCPKCEWIDTNGRLCPVEGTTLERVNNVIEYAIRAAILQSASVHEIRYHEPETALDGPIAALLRFDVEAKTTARGA